MLTSDSTGKIMYSDGCFAHILRVRSCPVFSWRVCWPTGWPVIMFRQLWKMITFTNCLRTGKPIMRAGIRKISSLFGARRSCWCGGFWSPWLRLSLKIVMLWNPCSTARRVLLNHAGACVAPTLYGRYTEWRKDLVPVTRFEGSHLPGQRVPGTVVHNVPSQSTHWAKQCASAGRPSASCRSLREQYCCL